MPALPRMLAAALAFAAAPAPAQIPAGFHAGPVIPDYGPVAAVDADRPIPPGSAFRISFDVAERAKPGSRGKQLESAARLLNMLAEAGVDPGKVAVALVVHGPATIDLLRADAYAARSDGAANANAGLIAALADKGVAIILCGQSAAALGVKKDQLLPGVSLALSVMTAHALLQQDGYTLNPF